MMALLRLSLVALAPSVAFALAASSGVSLGAPAGDERTDDPQELRSLAGLWEARRHFGPEVQGPLTITREGETWTAEIGPHRVPATEQDGWITFELLGDRGRFRGRTNRKGSIVGHWTQPETHHAGMRCASPVVLESTEPGHWRGEVVPLEDDFTFYLVAEERADGTLGAFLRNPERNFGVFAKADRLERDGNEVRLVGQWRWDNEESVLSRGRYDSYDDTFSLRFRGASFDFHRVDDATNDFYARGKDPEPWTYRPPVAGDDGWPVASLEDVGMTEGPLRELITTVIDPPAQTVDTPYVHGMLIARHGVLVVEEYFHGFHSGVPHDTRSAAKSLTSVLVGAAITAGEPIELSMPVLETVGTPEGHEPDSRAEWMTLEHLLTMSAGFHCDDSDPSAPGNEDTLQSQRENPDWYDYTLRLNLVSDPGDIGVYCSINPNLAGNVLVAATGRSIESLFHEYLAEPLEFGRYHYYLQPTGEPYLGGGSFFLPRDFLKLGQVLLTNGTWKEKRILSPHYAHQSAQPQIEIRGRQYGYLWWITEVPHRDTTVQAFYAGGNGGQVVMGIPALDLVALFYAGNYSDDVMYRIQEELVPEYVLRAVE